MAGDGAGDAVEVRGPATAGLEFVVGLVQRCVAGGAGVDARRRLVLVVLACEGGFGALFSEDAELLCQERLVSEWSSFSFSHVISKMGVDARFACCLRRKVETYLGSALRATHRWTVGRGTSFSLMRQQTFQKKSLGMGSRA